MPCAKESLLAFEFILDNTWVSSLVDAIINICIVLDDEKPY